MQRYYFFALYEIGCDSFRFNARNPTRRISCEAVPERIRRVGFHAEPFRKESDASDFMRSRSGRNPTRRILCGAVPERIRRVGFRAEPFRKESDASDFLSIIIQFI
jgi:hypothetical protein